MGIIINFVIKYSVLIEKENPIEQVLLNYIRILNLVKKVDTFLLNCGKQRIEKEFPEELAINIKNETMSERCSDIDMLIHSSEFFQQLPYKAKRTLLQLLFKSMVSKYKVFFLDTPDEMKYLIFKNLVSKV